MSCVFGLLAIRRLGKGVLFSVFNDKNDRDQSSLVIAKGHIFEYLSLWHWYYLVVILHWFSSYYHHTLTVYFTCTETKYRAFDLRGLHCLGEGKFMKKGKHMHSMTAECHGAG